jgi:hypothetical protein
LKHRSGETDVGDRQSREFIRAARERRYPGARAPPPGEIDAQRARRIIEELRRRFGEAFRPQLELDYIERLLKDY